MQAVEYTEHWKEFPENIQAKHMSNLINQRVTGSLSKFNGQYSYLQTHADKDLKSNNRDFHYMAT